LREVGGEGKKNRETRIWWGSKKKLFSEIKQKSRSPFVCFFLSNIIFLPRARHNTIRYKNRRSLTLRALRTVLDFKYSLVPSPLQQNSKGPHIAVVQYNYYYRPINII